MNQLSLVSPSMEAALVNKSPHLPLSSALPLIPILPEDHEQDKALFPPNRVDQYGEQLDLRTKTSWNTRTEEVSPFEMLEVQLVNTTVPFLLLSQLASLLGKSGRSFVVNVTSQEGQFSVSKTGEHVHTNMAKAALNMMTKTVAEDLAARGVYVNSVDTGWVSRMRPGEPSFTSTFVPLSIRDGAARVLDPIFTGFQAKETPQFGFLFKNFVSVPW